MTHEITHLSLLVEVSAKAGQITEGLEALAEALAMIANSRVRWWESELHRLRGDLILRHSTARSAEAEADFQQALAIAQSQHAKSLELRAAMSLARLWQHQGKVQAGYELLAPIYEWFTEGFDTADLIEAQALLDTLTS